MRDFLRANKRKYAQNKRCFTHLEIITNEFKWAVHFDSENRNQNTNIKFSAIFNARLQE